VFICVYSHTHAVLVVLVRVLVTVSAVVFYTLVPSEHIYGLCVIYFAGMMVMGQIARKLEEGYAHGNEDEDDREPRLLMESSSPYSFDRSDSDYSPPSMNA
jgi:hypothetical protein